MKSIRLFGSISLLFEVLSLSAQISPNEIYDCHYIQLNKKQEAVIKIPFHSIIVTDERPDTLKAGYYYPGDKDNGVHKICFKNGIKNQVSSFLTSYLQYENTSEKSILACIKKLWFGTYDTTNVKEDKLTLRTRKLFLKLEFYLNDRDCLYPIYRFDSTLNIDDLPDRDPSNVLSFAFQKSLRKLINGTYPDYQKLRCISKQQVDSFNNTHKRLPILNEMIAKKGVYMTIIQFQNNNPAHTEFNLKLNRSSDIVTIKGIEREDSVVNAWGICDGKKMYIRMGNNYFPLIKSGSSYDFFGFDTFFRGPSFNPYNTPIGVYLLNLATSKANRSKPFQLNLETGEIY